MFIREIKHRIIMQYLSIKSNYVFIKMKKHIHDANDTKFKYYANLQLLCLRKMLFELKDHEHFLIKES